MKKIIVAMVATVALLSSGVAEARLPRQNTHYSAQPQNDEFDIFGTADWGQEQGRTVGGQIPFAAKRYHAHSIFDNEDAYGGVAPRFKNRKQARHFFQEQEDNWGFGHASTSLVALGYDLQRRGFRVSEHPRFGGVHHVHHGWAHYAGRAIDINVGRGVVEARSGYASRFDHLASELRSEGYTVLWRVAGHYNHMHVQR